MPDTLEYPTPAASLPNANFLWLDSTGTPLDFSNSNYWSFSMKIGQPPNAYAILKTTGFLGLTSTNGSSNLIITWANNELSKLSSGRWYFQITATYAPTGAQRILTGSMKFDYAPM